MTKSVDSTQTLPPLTSYETPEISSRRAEEELDQHPIRTRSTRKKKSADPMARFMELLDQMRTNSAQLGANLELFNWKMIDKINDDVLSTKQFWTSASAWSNLLSGFGGGGLKILANFLPDAMGKTLTGVADALPMVGRSAESYIEGKKIKPQHEESFFLQTISTKMQKEESFYATSKELRQTFLQILQIREQMTRKASTISQ